MIMVASACSSDGEGAAATETTASVTTETTASDTTETTASDTTETTASDTTETTASDTTETTASDLVLRIAIGQEPVNIHPPKLRLSQDRVAASLVYSGLVRFNMPTTEIIPDLAESWFISDDGLTYNFKLRQGIQFHGGYGELTSADVKFTIDYLRDPENGASIGPLYGIVDEVTTSGDYEVSIILSEPSNSFLTIIAWHNGFIMSESAFADRGDELALSPIGTGPFEFVERVPGQSLTFARFDEYFGGPADIAGITLSVISSEFTQILAMENGEIDASLITTVAGLETAEALGNVNPKFNDSSTWVNWAHPNCRAGHLTSNKLFRQALMHSIDRQSISEASRGFHAVQENFLNPRVPEYTEDIATYEYDPVQAAALLDEAGYAGEPLSIMYTDSYGFEDLAQVMKRGFEEAGITVTFEKVEAAVTVQRGVAGDFDIWVSAGARNTADEYLSPYFSVGGPRDYGNCATPSLTEDIASAKSIVGEAAVSQAYGDIQREIMDEVYILPLSNQGSGWALGNRVNAENFNFDGFSPVWSPGDVTMSE
jgi:peptide/nickel transport system substrate-binding protein